MPRQFRDLSPARAAEEADALMERKAFVRERHEEIDAIFQSDTAYNPCWLVEGLIPIGYLVVLAGRPKDGKTCFAAALAAAVSRGDKFAGMRTSLGRVLYLAAEESPLEWDACVAPYLGEIDRSVMKVGFGGLAIDNPIDFEALRHKVMKERARLIVIDPLMAATQSGSFMEARRARHTLGCLKSLCRYQDCTATVVHHAKERAGHAHRVAENPQLAATASINIVLNQREVPEGRLVTLSTTGRGRFANRTLELLSSEPCRFEPWTAALQSGSERAE